MSVKQLVRINCDYCKASSQFESPVHPEQVSDWIEVRVLMEKQVGAGETNAIEIVPQLLNFCSAKCLAQAFKKVAEEQAAFTIDVEPLEPRVREKVVVSEEGEVTEVAG